MKKNCGKMENIIVHTNDQEPIYTEISYVPKIRADIDGSKNTPKNVMKKPCRPNCNSVHLNFHNCIQKCCAPTINVENKSIVLLPSHSDENKKKKKKNFVKTSTVYDSVQNSIYWLKNPYNDIFNNGIQKLDRSFSSQKNNVQSNSMEKQTSNVILHETIQSYSKVKNDTNRLRKAKKRHKNKDLLKMSLVCDCVERTSPVAHAKGNGINGYCYTCDGGDGYSGTGFTIFNFSLGGHSLNYSKSIEERSTIKMANVNDQFVSHNYHIESSVPYKNNNKQLNELKKCRVESEIDYSSIAAVSSKSNNKNIWYKRLQKCHILPAITMSNNKFNPFGILRSRTEHENYQKKGTQQLKQEQQRRRPQPLYTNTVSFSQKLWNHITTPTTYIESLCDVMRLSSNIRRVRLQMEADNFTAEYWDNILGGILFFPLGQCMVKNYYERTSQDQHIIEAINMNTSKTVAIKVLANRHLPSVQMELNYRRKMSLLNDAINKTYEIKYYSQDNVYHVMIDSPITSLKYLFKYCKMYNILLNFETIILKIWIDVFENTKRLLKHNFQLNGLDFSSVHLFPNYKFCIIDYTNLTDLSVKSSLINSNYAIKLDYNHYHYSHNISLRKNMANLPRINSNRTAAQRHRTTNNAPMNIQYLKQFMLNTLEYSDAGKIQQKIIYNGIIKIQKIEELEIYIINLYKRFFFQHFEPHELNKLKQITDIKSIHFEKFTRG